MSRKNLFKLIFDLVLLLLFSVLYHFSEVNLAFHEVTGLILLTLFAVHILNNWKWLVCVGKRLISGKSSPKVRFEYLINRMLIFVFIVVGISGVMCSEVLFPHESDSPAFWRQLHITSAALSLILMGVHVGMHLDWILSVLKKQALISEKTWARISPYCNVLINIAGVMGIVSTIGTAAQVFFTRTGGVEDARAQGGFINALLLALISIAAVLFIAKLTNKALKKQKGI
jgi:hypothetical protein